MSKRQLLCVIAVWVAVIPFLGIPVDWMRYLSIATGIVIFVITYSVRPQDFKSSSDSESNTSFADSNIQQ